MAKPAGTAPLFAEERRNKMLELMRDGSKLLVPELCEIFGVSPATIRNDLRDLEKAGRLKRTHGGAIPMSKASFEPDSMAKEVEHIDEKRRIAAYAISLVEDGDTIAVDTGTTTFEFAKLLCRKKDLKVVTNDIKIAIHLEAYSSASVLLIGGPIRRGFHCTAGSAAITQMSGFNVDKAFIAANALSPGKGFTTPMIDQAEIKKAMIAAASEVVFLVDSHKLGMIYFVRFAGPESCGRLVTDSGAGKKIVAQLREENKNLEISIV